MTRGGAANLAERVAGLTSLPFVAERSEQGSAIGGGRAAGPKVVACWKRRLLGP